MMVPPPGSPRQPHGIPVGPQGIPVAPKGRQGRHGGATVAATGSQRAPRCRNTTPGSVSVDPKGDHGILRNPAREAVLERRIRRGRGEKAYWGRTGISQYGFQYGFKRQAQRVLRSSTARPLGLWRRGSSKSAPHRTVRAPVNDSVVDSGDPVRLPVRLDNPHNKNSN